MCRNFVLSISLPLLFHGILMLCVIVGIVLASQKEQPTRCFQFTWLGPRFNNQSVFLNATCRDALRLASGVPCQMPLVASYDGTWPNIEYIWNHHSMQATCVLADTDVCAQFTYYFNGRVENSTYMCTRAVDSNNTAITSGCFEETKGSFGTKVCFCRSVPGGVPCNSANIATWPLTFIIIMIFFIINNLNIMFFNK